MAELSGIPSTPRDTGLGKLSKCGLSPSSSSTRLQSKDEANVKMSGADCGGDSGASGQSATGPQLARARSPGCGEWGSTDGRLDTRRTLEEQRESPHKTTALHWGSGKECSGPRLGCPGTPSNTTVYCGELVPPSVPTGVPTKVVCRVRAPGLVGWLFWGRRSDKAL